MKLSGKTVKGVFVVGSTFGLVTSVLVAALPSASAVSTCVATNTSVGSPGSADLQAVIDAASPTDRIQVKGVCVGSFLVDKDLTLVGRPTTDTPNPTIDGNDTGTVLSVLTVTGRGRTQLHLTNLRISGGIGGLHNDKGTITLTRSSVTGNQGPGIENLGGKVLLKQSSRVTRNEIAMNSGGGIWNRAGGTIILYGASSVVANKGAAGGGGIFSQGREGSVTLNGSSSVTGNSARSGAGILLEGGTLVLNERSTVMANTASSIGGGITIGYEGGRVTLNDSATVERNTARGGGGVYIYNRRGHLALNNSSAVRANLARYGGGIDNLGGTVTMNDSSTVGGNRARQQGGGIYENPGSVTLKDASTVRGNRAQYGGGIYIYHGIVTLRGTSAVRQDVAKVTGGGIFKTSKAHLRLEGSSTITGNTPNNCNQECR